jgi:hypothetical protein
VEKKELIRILSLWVFLSCNVLMAQQQNLPLEYNYELFYSKYLYGQEEKIFHSSFKPYLASEVYTVIYPDTTFGLQQLDNDNYFKKAINVIGYGDMLRFDEHGFIKPTYIDSSNYGVKIEMPYNNQGYSPRKFYVAANPIIRYELGYDSYRGGKKFYNLRGVELRGDIGAKVSIFTTFLEQQAEFPDYVQGYVAKNRAAPGESKVRQFKGTGWDFNRSAAYISYSPNKFFNVQIGSNKHFIGDGYRSLLLSDNSNSYPFVQTSTKFWRIKYVNIFAELINNNNSITDFTLGFPRKFATFNYLSYDIHPRVQVGLFEGIMWRRTTDKGHTAFDFNMLNPIIGIRGLQKNLDINILYGLNISVRLPKYISIYGQLAINELSGGRNSSTRRTGWQAGVKYFDVAGVKNLNLQLEYNSVRPYTYQGNSDSILHYSHYNQSLAHPMGANFNEILLLANYRYKRIYANYKFNYSKAGVDAKGVNYGADILKNAADANTTSDVKIGNGIAYNIVNNEFRAGYIINPKINMSLEMVLHIRKYSSDFNDFELKSNYFSLGMVTRLYNHYYDIPLVF